MTAHQCDLVGNDSRCDLNQRCWMDDALMAHDEALGTYHIDISLQCSLMTGSRKASGEGKIPYSSCLAMS